MIRLTDKIESQLLSLDRTNRTEREQFNRILRKIEGNGGYEAANFLVGLLIDSNNIGSQETILIKLLSQGIECINVIYDCLQGKLPCPKPWISPLLAMIFLSRPEESYTIAKNRGESFLKSIFEIILNKYFQEEHHVAAQMFCRAAGISELR